MRWLLVVLGVLMAAPATALAAGGPVPPVQGGGGATSPVAGEYGYVAVAAGANTVVEAIWRQAGEVHRTRLLRGRWGVPGVTYDGATTGLSGDGRTLVLAGMQTRGTKLLVLDARTLRLRDRISLNDFAVVDAISPDGRWLYVIRYPSPANSEEYEVRAYDLRNHRMTPQPIVDPHEPDEQMQGFPFSRAMSSDGRWAYTLYGGTDGEPFVHALDTRGRTARCIDLEGLTFEDVTDQKLTLSGGTLHVGRVALVDTKTFAVSEPKPDLAPAAPAAKSRPAGGGSSFPWWIVGAGILALVAAGAALARRPRVDAQDLPVQ